MRIPQNPLYNNQEPPDLAATWFAPVASASGARVIPLERTITCATHDKIHNKTVLGSIRHGWQNVTFTNATDLAEHLRAGGVICTSALDTDRRLSINALGVDLLGADFDGLSDEQVLQRFSFARRYAAIVYATSSSKPTAPRCRALFLLDRTISAADFRRFIHRLLWVFEQHADARCTDPARLWYGSTQPNYYVRGGVFLPVSVLEQLADPPAPPPVETAPFDGIPPTADELRQRYHYPGTTRNNALFETAKYARDHGVGEAACTAALVADFTSDPPRPGSNPAPQTADERQREARATIHSAYSHPARTNAPATPDALPNAIFEALSARKLKSTARVLDGLILAGYTAGRAFQAKDAISALPGMAQKTVRAVLKTSFQAADSAAAAAVNYFPFFHTPESATPTAISTAYVRVQNGEIIQAKRGRKAKTYTFPDFKDLARALGVTDIRAGDAVDPSDIGSARAYCIAKHAGLIRRNPAKQYSMKLLSDRLGVGRRTIHNYNKAAGIVATPHYVKTPVTWENLDELSSFFEADDLTNGMFLEDATDLADPELGKKYPPLKAWAIDLLKAKRRVFLVGQWANSYTYRPVIRPPTQVIEYVRLPRAAGAENATRVPLKRQHSEDTG